MEKSSQFISVDLLAPLKIDGGAKVLLGRLILELEAWPDGYTGLLLDNLREAEVFGESSTDHVTCMRQLILELMNSCSWPNALARMTKLANLLYDKGFVSLGLKEPRRYKNFTAHGLNAEQVERELYSLAGPQLLAARGTLHNLFRRFKVERQVADLASEFRFQLQYDVGDCLMVEFMDLLASRGTVDWQAVASANASLDELHTQVRHGVHTDHNGNQALVKVKLSSSHPLPFADQVLRQMEPGDYIKYRAPVVKGPKPSLSVPGHITFGDYEGVVTEVLHSTSSALAIGYKVMRLAESGSVITETISADWEIEFSHSVLRKEEGNL